VIDSVLEIDVGSGFVGLKMKNIVRSQSCTKRARNEAHEGDKVDEVISKSLIVCVGFLEKGKVRISRTERGEEL